MTERIRPGSAREVSPIAWVLARAGGRLQHSEPMNLFLVLGRHRRLFRGWLSFAARLMPFGLLPRRESELVILRVAHLTGSEYEWHQHERIARRAGLSAAEIAAVPDGADATVWTARQRTLLRVTDAVVRDGDVDDALWDELSRVLDERERLELVLLAGHYLMLARVIIALRIPVERPR